jgi:hypothetical protein
LDWKNKFLTAPNAASIPQKYDEVLKAFQSVVEDDGNLKLEIGNCQAPINKKLTIRATLIPSSATTMCILDFNRTGCVRCLPGHNAIPCQDWVIANSAEKFFDFLKSIYETDFFKTTIKIMKELNLKKDFDGFLHTEEIYLVKPEDIRLKILASEIRKIEIAQTGSKVEFAARQSVNIFPKTVIHKNIVANNYGYFESNGYKGDVVNILQNGKPESLLITINKWL